MMDTQLTLFGEHLLVSRAVAAKAAEAKVTVAKAAEAKVVTIALSNR